MTIDFKFKGFALFQRANRIFKTFKSFKKYNTKKFDIIYSRSFDCKLPKEMPNNELSNKIDYAIFGGRDFYLGFKIRSNDINILKIFQTERIKKTFKFKATTKGFIAIRKK